MTNEWTEDVLNLSLGASQSAQPAHWQHPFEGFVSFRSRSWLVLGWGQGQILEKKDTMVKIGIVYRLIM